LPSGGVQTVASQITGGVYVFHACGIPTNTDHHPERFRLDDEQ